MLEETFSLDAASPFAHVCYLHGFRHVQSKNAAFKGDSYTVRAGNCRNVLSPLCKGISSTWEQMPSVRVDPFTDVSWCTGRQIAKSQSNCLPCRCFAIFYRGDNHKGCLLNRIWQTKGISCLLTHLCRVDSFTSTLWIGPFPVEGVSGFFLRVLLLFYTDVHVFNANSVDPDQTSRTAASDQGLHCLLISSLRDTTQKWVKANIWFWDMRRQWRQACLSALYDLTIVCLQYHEYSGICHLNKIAGRSGSLDSAFSSKTSLPVVLSYMIRIQEKKIIIIIIINTYGICEQVRHMQACLTLCSDTSNYYLLSFVSS